MKRYLAIVSVCLVLFRCNSSTQTVALNNSLTEDEKQDGWELLFDGKSTSGWHTYGKDSIGKAWKADSTLYLDASTREGWQTKNGGDIVTNTEYDNFHLKLEWKISEGENSGIFFYVHEDTSKYKYSWQSGMEMQICDNEKNEDGKIDKARCGDLYSFVASSSQKFVKPAGQWNKVEIKADNGRLDFYMNTEHVLSTTLWDRAWYDSIAVSHFKEFPGYGTFKKGKIGLQDHGAHVWFRNIKIKKL
jgi:hypothetical protein